MYAKSAGNVFNFETWLCKDEIKTQDTGHETGMWILPVMKRRCKLIPCYQKDATFTRALFEYSSKSFNFTSYINFTFLAILFESIFYILNRDVNITTSGKDRSCKWWASSCRSDFMIIPPPRHYFLNNLLVLEKYKWNVDYKKKDEVNDRTWQAL